MIRSEKMFDIFNIWLSFNSRIFSIGEIHEIRSAHGNMVFEAITLGNSNF